MPVSGVIVVCDEKQLGSVRSEIGAHPRLEIRDGAESNLIVVTDTATVKEDRADVEWLESLPGVLSTHVAFTNVEDVAPESVSSLVADLDQQKSVLRRNP